MFVDRRKETSCFQRRGDGYRTVRAECGLYDDHVFSVIQNYMTPLVQVMKIKTDQRRHFSMKYGGPLELRQKYNVKLLKNYVRIRVLITVIRI